MPSPPPASMASGRIPSRRNCATSLPPVPSPRQTAQPSESASRCARSPHKPQASDSRPHSDRSASPAECRCRTCAPAARSRCRDAYRQTRPGSRAARTAPSRFSLRARAASSASSASLSTLNCRMPGFSARSISAAVLPTPENTTRPTRLRRGRKHPLQFPAGDNVEPRAPPQAASKSPAPSSPSPHSRPGVRAP
jgi:hypothetical protein